LTAAGGNRPAYTQLRKIPSAAPYQGREVTSHSGAIGQPESSGAALDFSKEPNPTQLPGAKTAPGERQPSGQEGSERYAGPASPRTQSANRLTGSKPGLPAANGTPAAERPLDGNEMPFPMFGQKGSARDARADLDDHMRHRRWGQSSLDAAIGLERPVTIQASADRLMIGNAPGLLVGQGETRDQLLGAVATAIDQQAQDWGRPPDGFYWIPSVKFIISPGGNQHYERLHGPLSRWGIASKVEYTLNAPAPAALPE
jgi:hypothetical protein